MKTIIKMILPLLFLLCMQQAVASGVLVEAESFQDKGGWVLDQQFTFQMGSPYLLAHGMGVPVANAKTKVDFPKKGKYHVWVRTKNWAPGNWAPPGRFRLVVGGKEIKTDIGTITGWGWQYMGRVKINKRATMLELKDLTGFDGRCDAIYFSSKKDAPPNDQLLLETWRRHLMVKQQVNSKHYDFVVVGGGIAGCAAAIAAAEKGLSVALIHDRPVLGGNASSEIRVHTLGQYGFFERIIKMIITQHHSHGSVESLIDDEKRMQNVNSYDNIHLFMSWQAIDVVTHDKMIKSVLAQHTANGEQLRFEAPVFADCTGDAWIGYWAGADWMYGRESKEHFGEQLDRPLGASLLWNSSKLSHASVFPEVPWAMEVTKEHQSINGEWYWEYSTDSLHQIDDAEVIRDHLLTAIYGAFYNAKKNPAHENVALEWVSYVLGKRASRRLVGDYIFTCNDARNRTTFDDAVVFEARSVDVHHQQVLDSSKPDFLSDTLYYKAHYSIPYRSLYSKDIKNLFMAGRNFSCSHLGLGCPRVMNITAQMGCVVGYAASLCVANEVLPRDIYKTYLSDLFDFIKSSDDEKVMIP